MELKKELESLLFSSGKIMSEEELAELTNSSKENVREALDALKQEYDDRDTSLMLVQTGENWKLNVREKYMNLVTKIVADTELSFPVLETLAVIAFKAPVIQAEVIKIRGTNAYEHIGMLANEEFVDKRKEGRSFRISLTPKFFKYFDVAGDKDIKKALDDVKVPEKVGDMDVIDIPAEEVKKQEEKEEKKLGDLEVVDARRSEASSATETEFPLEPEQTEKAEEKEEEDNEEDKEEKVSIENNKPDQGFIKDIDKRIGELRAKNDELDQDESFKRQDEVNKEMEEEKKKDIEEEVKEEVKEKTAPAEEKTKEAEETPPEEEEKTEEPAEETVVEEEVAEEEPAEGSEEKEEKKEK